MDTTAAGEAAEATAVADRALWRRLGFVALAAISALVLAYLRVSSRDVVTQSVVTGLLSGGVYGLAAMGLTLIFGVLNIVNFAHGSFMTLAMYGTFVLAVRLSLDPYLTLLITVPLMFGLGFALQSGLLNRTMGRSLESQLLITLGLGLLIENGLLLTFGGNPRSVKVDYSSTVRLFGVVADLTRILAFAGALLLAGTLYLLLRHTRVGTSIRAVAASPEGARLVGIDIRRTYRLTFALGAACAGAAGTLVAPFVTIEATAGQLFNNLAFVVVILGGMGNVAGALIGGLLIGLTEQLGGVLLPGQSPLLAVFTVFLIVLFVRPQGLFGREA
ncbi:branched-chain amino acid ABC transporter permease [Actinoallomurus acanthiterrae]